ncbi:MAG: hypothetical protein LBG80_20880 [Bacteroidales bacterium]|jgi:hypothetical protein|nr:hypothetical protein [Bacteroidales bacterium]
MIKTCLLVHLSTNKGKTCEAVRAGKQNLFLIKTDGSMGYNREKLKMRKNIRNQAGSSSLVTVATVTPFIKNNAVTKLYQSIIHRIIKTYGKVLFILCFFVFGYGNLSAQNIVGELQRRYDVCKQKAIRGCASLGQEVDETSLSYSENCPYRCKPKSTSTSSSPTDGRTAVNFTDPTQPMVTSSQVQGTEDWIKEKENKSNFFGFTNNSNSQNYPTQTLPTTGDKKHDEATKNLISSREKAAGVNYPRRGGRPLGVHFDYSHLNSANAATNNTIRNKTGGRPGAQGGSNITPSGSQTRGAGGQLFAGQTVPDIRTADNVSKAAAKDAENNNFENAAGNAPKAFTEGVPEENGNGSSNDPLFKVWGEAIEKNLKNPEEEKQKWDNYITTILSTDLSNAKENLQKDQNNIALQKEVTRLQSLSNAVETIKNDKDCITEKCKAAQKIVDSEKEKYFRNLQNNQNK